MNVVVANAFSTPPVSIIHHPSATFVRVLEIPCRALRVQDRQEQSPTCPAASIRGVDQGERRLHLSLHSSSPLPLAPSASCMCSPKLHHSPRAMSTVLISLAALRSKRGLRERQTKLSLVHTGTTGASSTSLSLMSMMRSSEIGAPGDWLCTTGGSRRRGAGCYTWPRSPPCRQCRPPYCGTHLSSPLQPSHRRRASERQRVPQRSR